MMEMGMDLVSDIPLPIDNEMIGEHPPSQKLCHLLVILDSIYILRASQWSLQIINKTLCRNGFSSCEPRKAAAKQMTRRNKIFISCFQKSMGNVNGNWKAWATSFNQKQHSGETRSHLVFKAVNTRNINAFRH